VASLRSGVCASNSGEPYKEIGDVRGTSRHIPSGHVSNINQLAMHHRFREAGAGGSNPLTPTILINELGFPCETNVQENVKT